MRSASLATTTLAILFLCAQSSSAASQNIWLKEPKTILDDFLSATKITQTPDQGYNFLGKQYSDKTEIPESELARIPAYNITYKSQARSDFKSFATCLTLNSIDKEIYGKVENFTILSIPGGKTCGEAGGPELPCYGRFISLPQDAQIKLVIDKLETVDLSREKNIYPLVYPLQPSATPVIDPRTNTIVTTDEFAYNKNAYAEDKFIFSDKIIEMGSDINMRGKRLAYILYHPVLYNPLTRQIKAVTRVDWHLEYTYPLAKSAASLQNKPWEKEFENNLMLLDATEQTAAKSATQTRIQGQGYELKPVSTGADYLIIVHDAFYQNVLFLAEWKEKKGYLVKIIKLSEILPAERWRAIKNGLEMCPQAQRNADPADNYTYQTCNLIADTITMRIKDIYNNWNPRPVYLLLVGDAQYLPPHYKNEKGVNIVSVPQGSQQSMPSDLYYALLDGEDYFPDIFIGRIPAASSEECDVMINKIITMERNPPLATSGFYRNALMVGDFSNFFSKPDTECTGFIEGLEGAKDFLQYKGWQVDTAYTTSSNLTTRRYEPGSILHNPNDIYFGNQAYITEQEANAKIKQEVERGICLLDYLSHGMPEEWVKPPYRVDDVSMLMNKDIPLWVNSISCYTGKFDYSSGIYDRIGEAYSRDCLAESWLKNKNGGAYAVVASTIGAPIDNNNYLFYGVHECIWPGYFATLATLPGYRGDLAYEAGSNSVSNGYHFGQIINFARMFMFDKCGDDFSTRKMFFMNHLFGCPEQEPRLGPPQNLTVNFPSQLTFNKPADFFITVTGDKGLPLSEARISLISGASILQPSEFYVGLTDKDGKVRFSFTPKSTGDMRVTVTQRDYFPFESKIKIAEPLYKVGGYIKKGTGVIPGILVTAGNKTTYIDPNTGYYSIYLPNGMYVVTPSLQGYIFTPASQTVTIAQGGIGIVNFSVDSRIDKAQFVGQSVPNVLKSGQKDTVTVYLKNTGNASWSATQGYKLGSQNPKDNNTWGINRVMLPVAEWKPGETRGIRFEIVAPRTPGKYNFQWQMLLEGKNWFGDKTPDGVTIQVQ